MENQNETGNSFNFSRASRTSDVEVNKEVVDKVYNNIDDIDFSNINITVLSPGVPVESEIAQKSIKSGVETIGEIEFGFRYSYRNNTCNNRNKW